ncbi:MAG: helix-turn-helix domain-containing protein [Gammaproteobacteria bacterium]
MEIRPVKTEADYSAALVEIERLWGAEIDTPEGDSLDVLMTLVDAYESKHHPIYPPSPAAAIRFALEARGLTPRDLEPYIGSRSRVWEVLNRKRPLTLAMVRKLHRGLGIPLESLIGEAA